MKYLQCCLSIVEHTSPFQKHVLSDKFSTIYLRINQPKKTIPTTKNLIEKQKFVDVKNCVKMYEFKPT